MGVAVMATFELNRKTLPQFIGRVQALCADTPRQWGTMDVTRMLRHLNFSADMSLGVEQVEDLSTPIVRDLTYLVLFKWVTKWPKGKMKAPDFVTPPPKGDFAFEQGELIRRLNLFVDELERSPDRTGVNPGLGRIPLTKWSRVHGVHNDHHLRQFGV
jgi:hypothetical protein